MLRKDEGRAGGMKRKRSGRKSEICESNKTLVLWLETSCPFSCSLGEAGGGEHKKDKSISRENEGANCLYSTGTSSAMSALALPLDLGTHRFTVLMCCLLRQGTERPRTLPSELNLWPPARWSWTTPLPSPGFDADARNNYRTRTVRAAVLYSYSPGRVRRSKSNSSPLRVQYSYRI